MEENNAKQSILVLIDSNAIMHRSYHALPKNMKTSTGELTNVVYGFTTTLIKVLEDLKPTHIAASFDISKATFRVAQYSEYKAHRVKADQEFYDQIPKVRELLEVLKIPIYDKEGYEADDCIGTIVERCSNQRPTTDDRPIIYIVTGDKDAFQLIDGCIYVYNLKHGLLNAQIVDREVIAKEWNLQPEDFIDLKALAGDPSDNIPGVPGIGPKTAIDLLQRFDTLVKLYEKISSSCHSGHSLCHSERSEESPEKTQGDPSALPQDDSLIESIAKELNLKPRILKLLIQYKDQAFLSQKLATINREVPIDFNLDDCKWGSYDKEEVQKFFKRMQFISLLKRFGIIPAEEPKTKEAKEQKEKDEQLKLL